MKEENDERKNILSKLQEALEDRDITTIIALMQLDTFKEKLAGDEPVTYHTLTEGNKLNQVMIIYNEKQIYFGSIKNGIRSGNGIFFTIPGKKNNKEYYYYDGDWSKDIPNGKGKTMEVIQRAEEGKTTIYGTATEGSYLNSYENGSMIKHFYINGVRTGTLTYTAQSGIPLPLTNEDGEQITNNKEADGNIIGILTKEDLLIGEYYVVDSKTVWGVKPFLNKKK